MQQRDGDDERDADDAMQRKRYRHAIPMSRLHDNDRITSSQGLVKIIEASEFGATNRNE